VALAGLCDPAPSPNIPEKSALAPRGREAPRRAFAAPSLCSLWSVVSVVFLWCVIAFDCNGLVSRELGALNCPLCDGLSSQSSSTSVLSMVSLITLWFGESWIGTMGGVGEFPCCPVSRLSVLVSLLRLCVAPLARCVTLLALSVALVFFLLFLDRGMLLVVLAVAGRVLVGFLEENVCVWFLTFSERLMSGTCQC